MTKLQVFYSISLLISLASAEYSAKMSLSEWNQWYERIMGNRAGLYGSGVQNLLALMRLHEGASEPVDEIKKATVDYWYDANIDKMEHCNVNFAEHLASRCAEYKRNGESVLEATCSHTHERVIKNCNKRFIDLANKQVPLNQSERKKLFNLGSLFWQTDTYYKFGMQMASIVGSAATKNLDHFVEAWQEGLCKRYMEWFEQFEELYPDTCTLVRRQRGQPDDVREWINALDACEKYKSRAELEKIFRYVKL